VIPFKGMEKDTEGFMSAHRRAISIALFVALIGLCFFLFAQGRLTPPSFVLAILVCALAVLLLHNLDVIQRLNFKGYGLETTMEMREIQKQVYAKVDEVKRMGEDIASMIARIVAQGNRIVGEDFPERLLGQRESLRQALATLGTDLDRREELVAPITNIVAHDLRHYVVCEVAALAARMQLTGRDALVTEIDKTLKESQPLCGLDAALGNLEARGLNSDELHRATLRYRHYLLNDCLPKDPSASGGGSS